MPPVRPAAGEKTVYSSVCLDSVNFDCLIIFSKKRKKTISYAVRYDTVHFEKNETPKPIIFVRAPAALSLNQIHSILIENKENVFQLLEKANKKEKALLTKNEKTYTNGSIFHYLGRTYKLLISELAAETKTISSTSKNKISVQLLDGELRVFLPRKIFDLDEEMRAAKIQKAIEAFYIEQADVFFNSRVDYFAEKYLPLLGSKPQSVKAMYYKSKWGCCTHQNDLKFNWVLIQAEIPVIDYVIVHELCHIRHKNHSAAFWNLVEVLDPKYKEKRRELKENGWILGMK